MAKKKYFYITTPIYYASGDIHIGHTYCCTIADALARYKRLDGYDVRFMTGSDEHGQKIAEKAQKANLSPKEYVDGIAKKFKEVWKVMNISYDYYVRTTDDNHVKCVKKVFSKLLKEGIIYLGEYKGWYCTPDESFWSDSQVVVEEGKHYCPECHREVHYDSEKCYFFNTKRFIDKLVKFYDSHPDFCPQDKLNEMKNNFIKNGIEDLCITRTTYTWGVQTDEDKKHVVYVWIDALLNYISALGYSSDDESLLNKYWSNDAEIIQLAGRDITRFHVIYWPMLLDALNLRMPDRILIHGLLLTRDGIKQSKSMGNTISPYPLVERYSTDALRYYLAREIIFLQDGSFTPLQFIDRYNADLANNYGNLLNRTLSMIQKYFDGKIPVVKEKDVKSKETINLIKEAKNKCKLYFELMNNYNLTQGISSALELIDLGNKYLDTMAPWKLANEGNIELLKEVLYYPLELIRIGSILLHPIMPEKTILALKQINADTTKLSFEQIKNINGLKESKISDITPLFPRLKKDDEVKFLTELIGGK